MGCFLGCFGFTTKKQKRIKPCNKFQVHQKYVPLDSEKENVVDSAISEPREKPKESSKRKVKKKVSFNLDVKTYERIQDDENNTTYFSEEEEKTQREYNKQETAKANMSTFPSSHRYYNYNNSEEEDEITLEDSDIDDLDEEEEEEEEDYGVSDDDDDDEEYNSLHIETENKYGNVEKLNKDESNEVARNHRNSVLLPVENLTQWKAVKARGAQQVKQQKENIIKLDGKQELPLIEKPVNHKPKPNGHGVPVDASLSNWLVSARTTSVNGTAVYYIQDRAVDQVVLDEVNII